MPKFIASFKKHTSASSCDELNVDMSSSYIKYHVLKNMEDIIRLRRKRNNKKIEWNPAQDIGERVAFLVEKINLTSVNLQALYFVRSINAQTRAYARIWGLGRIWQEALSVPPSYVIEVISEKFDRLAEREKDKVLLHELAHIPKNFTGSLLPHTHHRTGSFHDKLKRMIAAYDKQA